ncbi:glutathione S-transferase family protein [Lichenicola sp.]|uniref:glutathione S-transferase family protein n=1 Tax=Lichenicola sp. TaxID=2804529 RepID=UPI003B005BC5
MIEFHTWKTPNGRKVAIMLEELGEPYKLHPVDFSQKQQFTPEFLAISPNNKIPAIVDTDAAGGPLAIFESGAILTYLAERSGRFLEPAGPVRFKTLEWLYWQVGGLGPMLGQFAYFAVMSKDPPNPAAIERFGAEVGRLLGVLEGRLQASAYLGGEQYTIADMASYPWMVGATTMMADALGDRLAGKPAIQDWMARVGARPAVQAGMAIPA